MKGKLKFSRDDCFDMEFMGFTRIFAWIAYGTHIEHGISFEKTV